MRLTIFGATGRTGQHLLGQAVQAGHEVTVLVRDPTKLKVQSPHMRVLTGTLDDSIQVEQAISGAEAVISVLGPTRNEPTYEITAAIEVIIATMKKQGVRRLIVSAGAGVSDPNDAPRLINRFISIVLKLLARYVYEDMVKVVDRVRASGLDWTVVRVPMLTDKPGTGNVRVGYVGMGVGARITRSDMADFMLRQLTDVTYLLKAPAISN